MVDISGIPAIDLDSPGAKASEFGVALRTAANVYSTEDVDALLTGPQLMISRSSQGVFWTEGTVEPFIHRIRDRVFVGNAVGMGPSRSNLNATWVPDGNAGANWAPRDSQFCVMTDNGGLAITGMSKVSQSDLIATRPASIGVAGFIINDGDFNPEAYPLGWALYGDVQHEPVNGGNSYGLELAVKNKGGNQAATPYERSSGAYGLWLHGGGDPTYGGAAANPNNAGIMFVKNVLSMLTAGWNVGINFDDESLTYTSGIASAVRMAKGHAIEWWAQDGLAARIHSTVDNAANLVYQVFDDNIIRFTGANGSKIIEFQHVVGGLNNFVAYNAATGGNVTLTVDGSDANAGMTARPKGSGSLRFNSGNNTKRVEINDTGIGFFGVSPVARPTGVSVDAPAIHTALVALGLIAA